MDYQRVHSRPQFSHPMWINLSAQLNTFSKQDAYEFLLGKASAKFYNLRNSLPLQDKFDSMVFCEACISALESHRENSTERTLYCTIAFGLVLFMIQGFEVNVTSKSFFYFFHLLLILYELLAYSFTPTDSAITKAMWDIIVSLWTPCTGMRVSLLQAIPVIRTYSLCAHSLIIIGQDNINKYTHCFPTSVPIVINNAVQGQNIGVVPMLIKFANPSNLVIQIRETRARVFLATNITRYSLVCPLNIFHFVHLFVEYKIGSFISLQELAKAIAPFKVYSNAYSPPSFEVLDSLCLYDNDAVVYTEKQLCQYFNKDVSFVNGSFANLALNTTALNEWYEVFNKLCNNLVLVEPQNDICKLITSDVFATWYTKAASMHKNHLHGALQEIRLQHPLNYVENNENASAVVRRVLFERGVRKM